MIQVMRYDWGHQGLVRNSMGQLVDDWIPMQANSAGGVSVKFSVKNYGDKPVRKFTVYFTPYNGAYEAVKCQTRRESMRAVTSADLLGANEWKFDCLFENAWYNHSIRSISVSGIEVTYTDGTTQKCTGNYEPTEEEKQSEQYEGSVLKAGLMIFLEWLKIMGIIVLIGSIFFLPYL